MSPDEIRFTRLEHMESIADHEGEIAILRTRIRTLQKKCKHPDQFVNSCMGERGTYCPDCGYST